MNNEQQILNGQIDVFSCGLGFAVDNSIDEKRQALLAQADAVFGSRTLLTQCPTLQAEQHIIAADARREAQEALQLARLGKRVVVLASGDALYHGFGGTLVDLALSTDNLVFHPNITAFQGLFQRLGLPWSQAQLFSAHAGNRLPLRPFIDAPLAVMYAGSRSPAHLIAQAVLRIHPASAQRAAVLAEHLGTESERIQTGPLEELAATPTDPTSMLMLLPHQWTTATALGKKNNPPAIPLTLPLGLSSENYQRENNLITSPEVRAVALSRLRLPAWGVLWDIGAGSGSVGLEAAALRPNLQVFAVERNTERGAHIENNRAQLGLDNYTLHLGDAIAVCQTEVLPTPNCIFVGGGGQDLTQLLTQCFKRLQHGGTMVVSTVTMETVLELYHFKPEARRDICRLDVALDQPIAGRYHHLKPQNTIHLFTFEAQPLQREMSS